MSGYITQTDPAGGYIKADGETGGVRFAWCDCSDATLQPNLCGHGVRVKFFIEVVRGRDKAIAVCRA